MLQTSNLVDVLQWQPERLVRRTLWWVDVIEGIHDRHTTVFLFVCLRHLPPLEPWHLGRSLKHVVTMPA